MPTGVMLEERARAHRCFVEPSRSQFRSLGSRFVPYRHGRAGRGVAATHPRSLRLSHRRSCDSSQRREQCRVPRNLGRCSRSLPISIILAGSDAVGGCVPAHGAGRYRPGAFLSEPQRRESASWSSSAQTRSVLRPSRHRPLDAVAVVILVVVILFLPALTVLGMEHTLHMTLVLGTVILFHKRALG